MQAASPIVAVVKGERGYAPVFKALDLIDYKKRSWVTIRFLPRLTSLLTKHGTQAQPQTLS